MARISQGALDDLTQIPLFEDYLTFIRISDGTPRKATIGDLVGVAASGSGVFNVKNLPFNAIGDGVADDTAAIQAAINAAGVAGGIVDLGTGTYKVTSSLTVAFDYVKIRGAGKGVCSIFTSDASITPLVIGTLSTASKIKYPEIEGLTIQASSSATLTSGAGSTAVYALKIFGVTQPVIDDVIAKNGGAVFHLQNSDIFNFRQFQMICSSNSTYAARWYQGAVDDVTIGNLTACYFNTVASNQIALCLTEEISGTANEFNRLSFDACKFGGTSGLSGNYGVQFIAGLRGSTFKNCAFQYNTAGQFDFSGFDPGAGSYHIAMSLDGCSLIGTSGTPIVDTFHLPGANNIIIECRSISVQSTTNIWNIAANSPSFFITNSDFSVTNVINCSGGTPRFCFAGLARWGTISGAKVTGAGTPVITQLNGRSGSFITASKSTSTLLSGATTAAVTFGTALDITPSASDITINFTQNPNASLGTVWITSVSKTGFTLNTSVATANDTNFSYYCSVS